jgi:hypothetical protein
MYIIKRDGRQQSCQFDKIQSRISKLCYGLDQKFVNEAIISQKVIQGVYPGVTTMELDELAAQTAASFATQHPDYAVLAARIEVSNLHKQTEKLFSKVIAAFRHYTHPKTGEPAPLVSEAVYNVAMAHKDVLDGAVLHDRDFEFDYFGFKTLEKSYLLKIDGEIAERPQHMLMRVAVGIHMEDIDSVLETYNLLSTILYPCHAYLVQCGYAQSTNVELLLDLCEGG